MSADKFFGSWLPVCPSWTHQNVLEVISHPSSFALFVILSIVGFVFMLVTALKYNSVQVFDQKIRTPNISNTFWIFYFAAVFFRFAFFHYKNYFFSLGKQTKVSQSNKIKM